MYKTAGKQVIFEHRETKARTHIADAADGEKAHFLAAMANGPQDEAGGPAKPYNYMAEADKTCSVIFNPQNVDRDAFVRVLNDIILSGKELNVAKKLLFRGKTCEELEQQQPTKAESLAVEFDPINPMPGEVDMLHGLVGVITEAAEMAEVLLDRVLHGQFDEVNINEEAGDVSWYLARQLRGISAKRGVEVTFETMFRANIDKLHGRHGHAFDVFRDANRDLKAERVKLEAATPLFDTGSDAIDLDSMADPATMHRNLAAIGRGMGKESSPEMSSLAAKVLADPNSTATEKSLAGSVLSQDETKGQGQPIPIEQGLGLRPLDAIPARSRNDPPLATRTAPADALPSITPHVNVGINGGENLGDGSVERFTKRNVGDVEGTDA